MHQDQRVQKALVSAGELVVAYVTALLRHFNI